MGFITLTPCVPRYAYGTEQKQIHFRFPNNACAGATRNGTCYTEAECSARGGTNSGSCAAGFGVCCVSE